MEDLILIPLYYADSISNSDSRKIHLIWVSFIGTEGAVCHRLESSDSHNTFDDIVSMTISYMLDDTQIYFPRFITLNAESEHTVNREICAEKKLSGMQKLCIFWYLSLNFFTMAYSKAKKVLWPEICKIFMERSFPLFQ